MRAILESYGAKDEDLKDLLHYTKNYFRPNGMTQMEDELFLEAWRGYESSFNFLRDVIVEFNFPIRRGISESEEYIKAQEEGLIERKRGRGLDLKTLSLEIVRTPGGSLPVIILRDREEFEKVIRCFSYNNEPNRVPKSMGASTYAGYRNWNRIAAYKEEWFSLHKDANEFDWAREFERLKSNNSLYKDTFIVLSNGPYSAVPASEVGLREAEWREISLDIRKYHETGHYFTKRVLNSMRNNIIDEIFCDYIGLVKTTGTYRAEWALKFLGLENYPKYRRGGRLENYASVKSAKAKAILKRLVYETIVNISRLHRKGLDPYKVVYSISRFSLVELAARFEEIERYFKEIFG